MNRLSRYKGLLVFLAAVAFLAVGVTAVVAFGYARERGSVTVKMIFPNDARGLIRMSVGPLKGAQVTKFSDGSLTISVTSNSVQIPLELNPFFDRWYELRPEFADGTKLFVTRSPFPDDAPPPAGRFVLDQSGAFNGNQMAFWIGAVGDEEAFENALAPFLNFENDGPR